MNAEPIGNKFYYIVNKRIFGLCRLFLILYVIEIDLQNMIIVIKVSYGVKLVCNVV